MAQRPNPPRGMRDLLPSEVAVRRHLLGRMLPVYERYGFQEIETPALEEIDRLIGSEGGDNEKLIYKVLKRGLTFDEPIGDDSSIVDLGLRYDLTVPLARFFATNSNDLVMPFKAIQTGSVFRAERPQKGRYRQFVQLDIDVLGDPTVAAEVELLAGGIEALAATGLDGFSIRLNHRKLLNELSDWAGFSPEQRQAVLVEIDKMDKVGVDGVGKLLADIDAGSGAAAKLTQLLGQLDEAKGFDATMAVLPAVDDQTLDELRTIQLSVAATVAFPVAVELDATLVRGQGYYTGPIFEVQHAASSGSLGGGGRYDRMIAKLSGVDVPATGFSIGFERLFDLFAQQGAALDDRRRIALLHAADDDLVAVTSAARELREAGDIVRRDVAIKNRTGQLNRLTNAGFTHWAQYRSDAPLEVQPLQAAST